MAFQKASETLLSYLFDVDGNLSTNGNTTTATNVAIKPAAAGEWLELPSSVRVQEGMAAKVSLTLGVASGLRIEVCLSTSRVNIPL